MTYGVIDVGSNTIRLCIYDVAGGVITPLFSTKNTAGLIDYVSDGELSRKGIKKACQVLSSYRSTAAKAGIDNLFVFATASLRNISNSKTATMEIEEKTGLSIDVLTGRQEAVLDFKGASFAKNMDRGIMIDIGGGSTEVVTFEKGNIKDAVSLEFGSLFMYKNHVAGLFPDKSERKAIRHAVRSQLKKLAFISEKKYDRMIGIGGSIRAVKKLNDYRFENDGTDIITADHLGTLIEECKDEEKKLMKKLLRVSPDRIHTLIPGMLILDTICSCCRCEEIDVSSYGVREGYLYEKVVKHD